MHESLYDRIVFFSMRKKICDVDFERDHILIVDMELIGDSVMILPLIHNLKKSKKVCKIDVLCYERQKDVFERCSDVDDIIAIKDANQVEKECKIPLLKRKLLNFRYLLYLEKQLISKVINRYNVLMCPRVDSGCQDYMESAAFLSGIKKRYGYTWHDVDERKKKRRQQCFTHLVYSSGKSVWPYECASEFAELCGYLKFTTEAKLEYKPIKRVNGRCLPQRYVVLAMDTTSNFREWPVEKFCELGEKFYQAGYMPVLMGIKREYGDKYGVLAKRHKYINLIGQTSVAESIDVIGNADYYVGGDTGLSHIAGAVGTLGIVLFPHSEKCKEFIIGTPQVTRPFGDMICIQPKNPLSPCKDRCLSRKEAHCIKQISVDDVWQKVEIKLNLQLKQ